MEGSLKAETLAPGSLAAVQVGSEKVTIANAGGDFYAFSDVCTHRGCSLSEGSLSGQELTCRCHGARFDITTGEVLGGPARESLKTYPVSVSDGNVTVVA